MSVLRFNRSVLLLLAAAMVGLPMALRAQTLSLGRIRNFKWADLYESAGGAAEQTNRLRTLIIGTEAVPQGGGILLVKNVRIESYGLDGRTNIITQAPECVVNQPAREAFSAGILQVQTGDGQFATEGQGFLCRLTNYNITISNAVRTVLRQLPGRQLSGLALGGVASAGGARTNAPARIEAPITVASRRLDFDRASNRVLYSDDVQVDNAQLRIQSHFLRLHLDTNNAIQEIIAEEAVRITNKQDPSRAQADRAIYTAVPEFERLQLLGNAQWADGARSGRAETMTFDPKQNTLVAQNNAVLKLPRTVVNQLEGGPGALAAPPRPPPTTAAEPGPLANQFIEVHSAVLTVQLPTPHQPHRSIVARTNVVILSPADHSRASGDQATYSEGSGELTLTGKAEWQDDQRLMKAHSLTYNHTNNFFRARQNAFLKMLVAALGRPQSWMRPSGAGPQPSPLTNQVVEVTCQEFDYQEPWLTFRNGVNGRLLDGDRVLGTIECATAGLKFRSNQLERVELDRTVRVEQLPLGNPRQSRVGRTLRCERLEADLLPGGYFRQVVARTNVVVRQHDWPAGRTNSIASLLAADAFTAEFFPNTNAVAWALADGHVEARHEAKAARGNQTIYTATNDLLVLKDNAELELGLGGVIRSPRFQLQPFQRWLREGEVGPFGLPVLPPRKTNAAPVARIGS